MIKDLKIQNLILIESAEIPFCEGFNVLSGETGSGKTAIMEGLKAALGFRCDSGLVRTGASKAIIEAVVDIRMRKEILALLRESGIDHQEGEDLFIRREILAQGKSRAFINHQNVQISLLKEIGESIVTVVAQHANQHLTSLDTHRQILDSFASLNDQVEEFAKNWQEENSLIQQLNELREDEKARLRELEICCLEIEELSNANLKEGEEEELFSEYNLLATSEDRLQKATDIYQALTSDKTGAAQLKRLKPSFESLARQDPKVFSALQCFSQALIELDEVVHEVRSYISTLERDPDRLNFLSERLSLLARLKKKYGNSNVEMQSYLEERKSRLVFLENADSFIEELHEKISLIREINLKKLKRLSDSRKAAAKLLEKAVSQELQLLNMPKAQFTISISAKDTSSTGQDLVEFFLAPNPGESPQSIRECASGGELSRVLLAFETLLSGKEEKLTLVFDEVDANIGGATASIVGKKLKSLGLSRQVICITHFPQVALHANNHLHISKEEREGRTITLVSPLDHRKREKEISRMMGHI